MCGSVSYSHEVMLPVAKEAITEYIEDAPRPDEGDG